MEDDLNKLFSEVEQSLKTRLDDELLAEVEQRGGEVPLDKPSLEQVTKKLKAFKAGQAGFKKLLVQPEIIRLDTSLKDVKSSDMPSGKALNAGISQISYWERTQQYKSNVYMRYYDAIREAEQLYKGIADGRTMTHKYVEKLIEHFFETLVVDRAILLNLSSIRLLNPREDYLYSHALNVCLIALNIATALGYSQEQVIQIGEAALLSDTGMMLVPKDIRFKKGKLTSMELFEVKKHPVLSYYLLEEISGLPKQVLMAAYQHHERVSGKGYPKQRPAHLIHNYAQLVGVADVYEAISSNRVYRSAHRPYKAMETILHMANKGVYTSLGMSRQS